MIPTPLVRFEAVVALALLRLGLETEVGNSKVVEKAEVEAGKKMADLFLTHPVENLDSGPNCNSSRHEGKKSPRKTNTMRHNRQKLHVSWQPEEPIR